MAEDNAYGRSPHLLAPGTGFVKITFPWLQGGTEVKEEGAQGAQGSGGLWEWMVLG